MDKTTQAKKIDFSVIVMLESLLQDMGVKHGHDTQGRLIASVEELTIIAEKLSNMGGKKPSWTWRYLRNVLNGKLKPSQQLTNAITALGTSLDGMPMVLARAKPAPMIYTVPELSAGAVILVKEKVCALPSCSIRFVGYPAQRYCCPEHREKARRLREKDER